MSDFPVGLSNVQDGVTEILAKHINNLEAKVGINNSTDPNSLDYKSNNFKNYTEVTQDLGAVSSPVTLDLADGNVVFATAPGACTWNMPSAPASGKTASFTLILKNGGTGTQTFTDVKWPGGSMGSLTASGVDVLTFFYDDVDSCWRGALAQTDSK